MAGMKRAFRRFRRKAGRKSKGRKGRKGLMPNTATSGRGQMAKIVETIEFTDLQPNVASQSVFKLAQFPRAATLAGSFAFYKAAKVVWNYEPLYNTFQDTAAASSVPYLYTLMNRGQLNSLIVPTLKTLQACGARPVKLTSKTTISYRPNWCSPGLAAVLNVSGSANGPLGALLQQGVKQQYDWLACSGEETRVVGSSGSTVEVPQYSAPLTVPIDGTDGIIQVVPPALILAGATVLNNVVYNGHVNLIDQQVDANPAPVARLTCTVTWLFKGAQFNQTFETLTPP